jgi:hypothetical protein
VAEPTKLRATFCVCVVGALTALPRSADAQPWDTATASSSKADPERVRGMAELGVGMLTLPNARVCVAGEDTTTCSHGDTSLMLEAWQLVSPRRAFALGAGITLGVIPTKDAVPTGSGRIERDHRRGYFTGEAIARYYPVLRRTLECWVGLTAGLVVVGDTFTSSSPSVQESDKAFVGPRGVTIRTEGYTMGLATGAMYNLTADWYVGGNFRIGSWFLPQRPERDALGDEASLTGRTAMFLLGLTLAYRVTL